jgi:cytochrome oxidase Cu insertion factor (SCO1/SenC/PrrC family)
VFLFFSVARSAQASQAERANEATTAAAAPASAELIDENGEKMPTDKLLDVSPLALRMSSPFNSGYWLTAA